MKENEQNFSDVQALSNESNVTVSEILGGEWEWEEKTI